MSRCLYVFSLFNKNYSVPIRFNKNYSVPIRYESSGIYHLYHTVHAFIYLFIYIYIYIYKDRCESKQPQVLVDCSTVLGFNPEKYQYQTGMSWDYHSVIIFIIKIQLTHYLKISFPCSVSVIHKIKISGIG